MADLAAFLFDRRKSGEHQGRQQMIPDPGRNGIECPFPTLACDPHDLAKLLEFPRCSPESGCRMEARLISSSLGIASSPRGIRPGLPAPTDLSGVWWASQAWLASTGSSSHLQITAYGS